VLFVSLTWHLRAVGGRESKEVLWALWERFERRFGKRAGMWKLEPQQRGSPHFHLMIFWGESVSDVVLSSLVDWFSVNWHELAEPESAPHLKLLRGELPGSRPCVELARSRKVVGSYVAKYLCKCGGPVDEETGEQLFWGRLWGRFNRAMWPAVIERVPLTDAQAAKVKRECRRWYERQGTDVYVWKGSRSAGRRRLRLHKWEVVKEVRKRLPFAGELRPGAAKLVLDCLVGVTGRRESRSCRRGRSRRVKGCLLFCPGEVALRWISWAASSGVTDQVRVGRRSWPVLRE
jgi:hypothetical protein